MARKKKAIVDWDVDEATYIGDEDDGVYYQVAKGRGGWYMTAVVDSNTGSFVDTIATDDGPYKTKADAEMAGKNAALEWCANNEVLLEDEKHPISDWQYEVANGDTLLGYREWLEHQE